MGIRIHLDHLPIQYQNKLKSRQLSKETIESLATSVSEKYLRQKKLLKRIAVWFSFLPLILALLGLFGASSANVNNHVFLLSCMFALLLEWVLLIAIYYLAVTRVPRQFSRCLKKGYPELEMTYGYEVIVDGSLVNPFFSHQLPFSLYIENVLELNDCHDVVITGFAHGLIRRNTSVYITNRKNPPKKQPAFIVTGIEIASGIPALEAADCPVALRIKDGKTLPVCSGMYAYRKEP